MAWSARQQLQAARPERHDDGAMAAGPAASTASIARVYRPGPYSPVAARAPVGRTSLRAARGPSSATRLPPGSGRSSRPSQADPPDRAGPASFIAGCSCSPLPPGGSRRTPRISRDTPVAEPCVDLGCDPVAEPAPPRTGRGGLSRPARSRDVERRPESRSTWFAGRPESPCSTTCLSSRRPSAFSKSVSSSSASAPESALARDQRQGWPHASRRTLARGADRGRAGRRGSSWRLGSHQTRPAARDGACGHHGFQVVRYTWDQVTIAARRSSGLVDRLLCSR